jgi:histone acetyltransferase 1
MSTNDCADVVLPSVRRGTNEVVTLVLPSGRRGEEWATFQPTFTYFAFGEDEILDGSGDAAGIEKILLKYTPSTARCLLDVQMAAGSDDGDRKRACKFVTALLVGGAAVPRPVPNNEAGQDGPDDGGYDDDEQLTPRVLPEDFTTDNSCFCAMHADDLSSFVPFGQEVNSFSALDKEFAVFKSEAREVPGTGTDATDYNSDRCAYHARVEKLALFFIEGADSVDLNDERWVVYYLYCRTKDDKSSSSKRAKVGTGKARPCDHRDFYMLAGYYTVFRFLNPVRGTMWRICQALVLPQFQRQGHGKKMYRQILQDARQSPGVAAVNVEDPAPGFRRLRDVEDVQDCCNHGLFFSKDGNPFKQDLLEQDLQKAREVLKFTPQQGLRCQEIMAYCNLDKDDEAASKAYRLSVKRRLHKEHGIASVDESQRKQKLQALYEHAEEEYILIEGKIRRQ